MRRFCEGLLAYGRATSGAAAAEFAIWLVVLTPAFIAIADVGTYAFRAMQVANAGQAGAQAVWANCSVPPVSTNCTSVLTASTGKLAVAIENGSALGSGVSEVPSERAEGYYCSTGGVLTANGTDTCPTTAKAGYYFKTRVSYTYAPIFPAASIVSLLPNPITRDVWIRLK